MKDIFATDQKAGPNNIPQRYVEYTSINVGITKFNDNAAITGLLGYREGNKDTVKLTNISAAELREPRTLLDLLYSSDVMLQKQDCTGPVPVHVKIRNPRTELLKRNETIDIATTGL